jgi:hypothetical protein
MQITINNVDVQNKGKYQLAVVEYNTADGKTEKKNVVSFTNKALYSTLSTAKQGDVFDVKLGKNDKGYWEFQEATKSQGGAQASYGSKASTSPKSTYETPEERAARQVYIIRQSSLSTAAAILTVGAKSVQVDDVIKTAKQLEAYVFGKTDESFFEDMPEDIPTIE